MDRLPFIGKMDRKVKIVKYTTTQNSVGEPVKTEVVVCSPFANLHSSTGGEDIDGKVRAKESRHYIIRFYQEVNDNGSDYFLIDEGQKYNIEHVEPLGRRNRLKLKVMSYE